MSALPEIAREAGLDPLVCPYCHRKVGVIEAVDLLFRVILERVKRGEAVQIRGFGTFKRRWHIPRGITKAAGGRHVLTFNAVQTAKEYLNHDDDQDQR